MSSMKVFFFFFFFFLIQFYVPFKIISAYIYETGQSVGGRKRESPEKNHLAHPQAELMELVTSYLLTMTSQKLEIYYENMLMQYAYFFGL